MYIVDKYQILTRGVSRGQGVSRIPRILWTSYVDGLKARKAFDEALQREHGGGDGGEEFRKKVTESLEGLDRKGRKGIQSYIDAES